MSIPRVAVIVVHGVADQQPGETARSVVELLVSSAPEKTCYTSAATADLTLRVPPLQPQDASVPSEEIDSTPTPSGEDRGAMKSLRQSLRSDFQRNAWASKAPQHAAGVAAKASAIGAPPTGEDRGIAVTNYLLTKHIRNGALPETYDTTCVTLQRHAIDPDAPDAAKATPTAELDVYEMYWADLSRLSGSVPRIVSELFTLVFRLSKLGRETVDEMWGQLARARKPEAPWRRLHTSAWNVVAWLQIGLDWLFVNGLALLFAQLALLGILLVCLGFTSGIAPEVAKNVADAEAARLHQRWLHDGVAIGLIVIAVLRLLYRRGDGKWLQSLFTWATIAGVVVAFALGEDRLQWLTAFALIGALTLANEFLLRVADDRFPLVHAVGRWMWAVFAAMLVANAVHEAPASGIPPWREMWVHAALFTTETVLLAIKWWWIVVGPLLVVWFFAGQLARGESGYASRASIATGRLGVTVSMGMFLAVTMTIWALVNNLLSESVDGVRYQPCVFAYAAPASVPAAASAPVSVVTGGVNACIWTSRNASIAAATPPVPSASAVLFDRYANSTSAFSVLATLLLTLVAYLLVMFTPSVLAELKLIVESRRNAHKQVLDERQAEKDQPAKAAAQAVKWQQRMDAGEDPDLAETPRDDTVDERAQNARELGRWLTFGYRHLDFIVGAISFAGIVLGVGITALFLSTVFEQKMVTDWLEVVHLKGFMKWIASFKDQASGASRTLFSPLQALVFSAAGVGATLSLLGGQLSRRLPSLRGPLDIALDVDNHFREFPRTNIPRAQIFSRYAALLERVRGQGYERIVVVSHSQGTVISSELLRFLSSRGQQAPREGQTPCLRGNPLPPVSLLTLGSPLRQLYGARFPGLYAWVLAKNGQMFGPRAADIGVQRWMNAFCSGDYVGRWLWSDASQSDELVHPMVNDLAKDAFGRADAYTGFSPMPPLEKQLDPASEVEVCLGLGAHTHYFERDQTTVAWMIDYLVRAPLAGQPGAPEFGPGPVPTIDAQAGQPARIVAVEASVVSDGSAAPAAAPDTTAPPPPAQP